MAPSAFSSINLSNDTVFPTDDFIIPDGFYGNDTIAPWTDVANQDLISPKVAITSDYAGVSVFNALVDGDYYNINGFAPSGTTWAMLPEGKTFEESRCSLRFCSFDECFTMYSGINSIVNKPGVIHLVEEDFYYNIMFTNFTNPFGSSGGRVLRESQPEGRRSMEKHEHRRTQGHCDQFGTCYGPGYSIPNVGASGGFQYVRDEFPIAFDDSLVCPKCDTAKAFPSELNGPVDESWREVAVRGVTPADAVVTIIAVGQDFSHKCNKPGSDGKPRPNAMGVGNSTVELRRTTKAGHLASIHYSLYFKATTAAGSCNGELVVCSAPEGMSCENSYYNFDASMSESCNEYY